MRKRPLCVALLFLVVGIVIVHSKWEEKLPVYEGEKLTLHCELEELTGELDSITLLVRDVQCNQNRLCHRMKLYAGQDTRMPEDLHIGNLLQVEASVSSFSKPGNPGQFNEYQYNTEQGISYKGFATEITVLDSRRDKLRDGLHQLQSHFRRIIEHCCDAKTAGIVVAMVLGDKSGLSEDTKKLYQQNGIAHVLAISGLHISLIGAGLFFLLRRYVMPMQAAVIVTLVLLVVYGILTGFSVSTQRAVTMMGCLLFARLVGRRYDPLSALAFSAIIQLLVHPFVLFETDFLLSYGTVTGIVLFVKSFQELDIGSNIVGQAFLGSLGIQLVTLPVLFFSYYEISLYSVIANMLLLPLMGGILMASIGGIGLGSIYLMAGKFCFGFVHYCFLFFDFVCIVLSQLPGSHIISGRPYLAQILLYYIGIFLFCIFQKKVSNRRNLLLLFLSLIVLFLPVHRVTGVQITNLDVGQGDCTCIRTEDGTVLVDGGSSDVKEVGKYRIIPFLKSQGISRLTYLFITHSDGDHISGIQEVLKDAGHMGIDIGKVILPEIEKKDEAYYELLRLCKTSGVSVSYMGRGDRISFGDVEISCLHPYASYDWETENNYSLVLRLQYRRFVGLFTGDLECAGEEKLRGKVDHADYLKVGHHGSKGASSKTFLQEVSPTIAVLSAGKKNRYGHPSPEVRKRLADVGARAYSTIEGGAVTVETDGYEMDVGCYKESNE